MDFGSFPFDEQLLPIVIQHRRLPAAKITYVPDPDNLEQSQASRLESGVDAGSTIDQIPNWQAVSLNLYPQSVGNTAALGDPYFVAGNRGITYSQMVASNEIARDVLSFLIKNLLPLLLLTIVTYISLWLPLGDGARISFAVTGILTGAVMLATVTGSLPSVDYTVAIEWAYYAFIGLAAACVLTALIGRNLTDQRKLSSVRTLEITSRILYPLAITAIVIAYWCAFR